MKIVLIRHGATKGNLEKRYIGRTDEDLCGEGIKKLKEDTCAGIYPPAQAVFSSPMKRCLSTAECIYPVQTPQIVWDFRECDFGLFEGKNYKELTGNPQYQQWIDSNGTLPFPGGEALTDFKKRSVRAFLETVSKSESILKGQVTSGNRTTLQWHMSFTAVQSWRYCRNCTAGTIMIITAATGKDICAV